MTEFIKKTNISVATAFMLRDLLEEDIMQYSAFFEGQFAKKSLLTRVELNRILNKIQKTQNYDYISEMVVFSTVMYNFTNILFTTAALGKQLEFIKKMEEIAEELGCVFMPNELVKPIEEQ